MFLRSVHLSPALQWVGQAGTGTSGSLRLVAAVLPSQRACEHFIPPRRRVRPQISYPLMVFHEAGNTAWKTEAAFSPVT